MQGPARVLIVGREDGSEKNLINALRGCGFESAIGDLAQAARELSGHRLPDIVILNMRSPEARENPRAFLALAETLKQSTLSSRMRVMLIAEQSDLALEGAAKHIDDLLIGDMNTAQVCNRIRSLIRLNTMHEELVRRLGTSAKYGLDAPPPITPPGNIDDATILVVGDAADFATIENTLATSATLIGALTLATALDYLTRRSFDAVVVNADEDAEPYLEFVRDLRRNSRFYNMPVVLLAEPAALEEADGLYEAGVTDAIAKPFSDREIRMRVDTLVRETRFRDSLKGIYNDAKHFATCDSLTGLYNRGFLLEHLAAVINDTVRTSQSVSLAGISIANMPQLNSMLGYAGGDRVIRQVGELVALLIRGEDLACRYSGTKFAILLPDTSVDNAVRALGRISGVIANTEFAVEEHFHPISVALNTGIASYQDGDNPENLIARSWTANLKAAA